MTPVLLYRGQPGTAAGTLATATTTTVVKQVVIANVTAVTATLTLSLVPSGGTAGVTNRLCSATPFPGNSITTIDLAQVMTAGDFLSALQGTAAALTLTISGVTF